MSLNVMSLLIRFCRLSNLYLAWGGFTGKPQKERATISAFSISVCVS